MLQRFVDALVVDTMAPLARRSFSVRNLVLMLLALASAPAPAAASQSAMPNATEAAKLETAARARYDQSLRRLQGEIEAALEAARQAAGAQGGTAGRAKESGNSNATGSAKDAPKGGAKEGAKDGAATGSNAGASAGAKPGVTDAAPDAQPDARTDELAARARIDAWSASYLDSGAFPELQKRGEWLERWRAMRKAFVEDLNKALAVSKDEAESQSLIADREFFLTMSDRAPWRAPAEDPTVGAGDGSWTAIPAPAKGVRPTHWTSCGTSATTTTRSQTLRIPLDVPNGELSYEVEFRLKRMSDEGACTFEFLDATGALVECKLKEGHFTASATAATVNVRVRVSAAGVRVELDGAVVFPGGRARGYSPGAIESASRGVVRVTPDRFARFDVSELHWKPLRPVDGDGEPRPVVRVEQAPRGLADVDRDELARARLEYARVLREITEAARTEIAELVRGLERRESAGELPSQELRTLEKRREERAAYDREGDWPPTSSAALERRWTSARTKLDDVYVKVIKTLGRSRPELALAANFESDRAMTRAADDRMPWRAFDRALAEGIDENTTTEWIGSNEIYTSPKLVERSERDALAELEHGRATLSLRAQLPVGDQEYALELALERLDGTGGCTLAFPDGSGRTHETHLAAELFAQQKPRFVFVFVFDGRVRVDVDGVTVYPEDRAARVEAPKPSVDPIAICLTPDERTQWRASLPHWKRLTPVKARK